MKYVVSLLGELQLEKFNVDFSVDSSHMAKCESRRRANSDASGLKK